MRTFCTANRFALLLTTLLVLLFGLPLAANPPETPKISTFAPAEDLIGEVHRLVDDLKTSLESTESYDAKVTRVRRHACTLVVLSMALGLHDTDHELKPATGALLSASRQLAQADDYKSCLEALAAVEAALESRDGVPSDLKWEKAVSMGPLMKHVSFTHTRLRRNTLGRRFERERESNAAGTAVLAVIGQATLWDTHEVKDPARLDEWYQLCAEMRDAAGATNAAIHAGDLEATAAAMQRLEANCNNCHKAFRDEKEIR